MAKLHGVQDKASFLQYLMDNTVVVLDLAWLVGRSDREWSRIVSCVERRCSLLHTKHGAMPVIWRVSNIVCLRTFSPHDHSGQSNRAGSAGTVELLRRYPKRHVLQREGLGELRDLALKGKHERTTLVFYTPALHHYHHRHHHRCLCK